MQVSNDTTQESGQNSTNTQRGRGQGRQRVRTVEEQHVSALSGSRGEQSNVEVGGAGNGKGELSGNRGEHDTTC